MELGSRLIDSLLDEGIPIERIFLDSLDEQMRALVFAAEALAGRDRFCLSYVKAYNDGKLKAH